MIDIAPGVMFECGSHRIGAPDRRAGEGIAISISIGSGTWIGVRVTPLGGTEVGPGSLVAAGSIVRAGKYPANMLLASVSARAVKELSAKG